MKIHEQYFHRNQGHWIWETNFQFTSWTKFLSSSLSLKQKIRFSSFVVSQWIVGPSKMETDLHFDLSKSEVQHRTRLSKFGVELLRSEKTFALQPNGNGLTLQGNEFFWPCLKSPVPFKGLVGTVEDSTTRAMYQIPMLGSVCDCKTVLEPNDGSIQLTNEWMSAKFNLVPKSKDVLRSRFTNDGSQ